MIKRIHFASIPSRDQAAALDFFTNKLGFLVRTNQPFYDGKQRWIELSIPGAETGVVLFTPEGHESRIGTFSNIVFHTDNVQKTYEELRAKGVEFTQAPKTEAWGTSAQFRDPDGNTYVLSSH